MTDFASLLAADRGQKARPIHLVDKDSFDGWLKKRPAEDRALARGAAVRRQDRLRLRPASARRRFRGGERGQERRARSRPGASPSSARACPKAPTSSPTGEPGKAALGWLLGQHRFDAYRSKKDEPERGPRVLVTGEAGADRRDGPRSPKRPRWSATSSTRPPATSARPSSSRRCATRPTSSGAQVRVTAGEELDRGLSADRRGRRAPRRGRARRA